MSKQSPSDFVIIPTNELYILPLQLFLGLTCVTMQTYPPEELKILSHFLLTPNMDWDPIVLNCTAV